MSEINHNAISKELGISPKACERITGSTRIELVKPDSEAAVYEIGLRIEKKYLENDLTPAGLPHEMVIAAFKEYAATCPVIYNWLCSGNFAADKLPLLATAAIIIHACRTAGRIRASLLK